MALLVCGLVAGCLDAPPRGEEDDPDDVADRGDPAPGGGPDAGAMAPAACADGSAVEVVHASRFEVPIGQNNFNGTGLLLVSNTGDVALDSGELGVGPAAAATTEAVAPVVAVDQTGGTIDPGEASGLWGFDDLLLDAGVRERWTDTTRPSVDVSLAYDISEETELRVYAPVRLGPLTGVLTIDVLLTSVNDVTATASARVPLVCSTQ